jgi:hypothetical protein
MASLLSLAALLFLIPAQVRADDLNFTFTENGVPTIGDVTVSWSLPATLDSTTPGFSPGTAGFVVTAMATITTGGSTFQAIDLFNFNDSSLGIEFATLGPLSLSGVPTLFSGTGDNPTFIPGVYNGFDTLNLDVNGAPDAATLSIGAPEPSSILMLCIGLLVVAGALAVKKAAA